MQLKPLLFLPILLLCLVGCSPRTVYTYPIGIEPFRFSTATKLWLLERPWPPHVQDDFARLATLNAKLAYLQSRRDAPGPAATPTGVAPDNPAAR